MDSVSVSTPSVHLTVPYIPPTEQYFKVDNALIDSGALSMQELAVYIVIARHINAKTQECFLGMQTIADKLNCMPKTARRYRDSLAEKGYIAVEKRYNPKKKQHFHPTIYRLTRPTSLDEPPLPEPDPSPPTLND